MAIVYTVDASVFINSVNPFEPDHQDSRGLLDRLRLDSVPIHVPTLLIPEVAGAVARAWQDNELAKNFAGSLAQVHGLVLVPLDRTVAERAAEVAARHRLRGSDAVYAAVALGFGAVLVTRDREQRERLAEVLPTRYPHEALAELD